MEISIYCLAVFLQIYQPLLPPHQTLLLLLWALACADLVGSKLSLVADELVKAGQRGIAKEAGDGLGGECSEREQFDDGTEPILVQDL